jgi:hypothetical protein
MKNQWLSLALVLLLAAILAFMVQDIINQVLVKPLLYLFWVGRLILATLPQSLIWGVFLLGAVLITWANLFKRRRRGLRSPIRKAQPSGRVETWLKLIQQAQHETYYKWQLAQQLRKLTLGALAHDERLTRHEIRQRLATNALALPPDIQAYLQASTTSFGYFSANKSRWLRGQPATPLDLKPEKIAHFLEGKFNL